jgi:hypothetical protein
MTTGEKISVIAIVVGIILQIIYFIRKRFFVGARLHITLTIKQFLDGPKGFSPKNDFSNGPIDAEKAIKIFETKWKYEFKFHNVSQKTFYKPELYFIKSVYKYKELKKLSEYAIIKPDTSESIKGEIITKYECLSTEREKCRKRANEIEKLKLIVKYKNEHNSTFYSIFKFENEQNINKRRKIIFRKRNPL